MTLEGGGCDFFDFLEYFLDFGLYLLDFGFSQELFQLFKNNITGLFDKNYPTTYICTTTYLSYTCCRIFPGNYKYVVICDLDCEVLAWTGKNIEIFFNEKQYMGPSL